VNSEKKHLIQSSISSYESNIKTIANQIKETLLNNFSNNK